MTEKNGGNSTGGVQWVDFCYAALHKPFEKQGEKID